AYEVHGCDRVLTEYACVVAYHEASIRPSDEQHGPQSQNVDYGGNVLGPRLRLCIALRLFWLFGHSMAAKVESNQPELIGQIALILPAPAQAALRPSVYEKNCGCIGLPPFPHVQLHAIATGHRM